jgi:hypothetical protein
MSRRPLPQALHDLLGHFKVAPYDEPERLSIPPLAPLGLLNLAILLGKLTAISLILLSATPSHGTITKSESIPDLRSFSSGRIGPTRLAYDQAVEPFLKTDLLSDTDREC